METASPIPTIPTIPANTVSQKGKPVSQTRKNVTRTFSYVIGAISLVMLIAAIVMLVILRNHKTVIVTIYPSTSVPVTPLPTNELTLQKFSTSSTAFTPADFNPFVSPVASVSPFYVSPSSSIPIYNPGELPFDDTISAPLKIPSQGFGYCAFTPAADQWFTSFVNGDSVIGQYVYTKPNFTAFPTVSGQNTILFTCDGSSSGNSNSSSVLTININATSVGCVGYSSIVTSLDGMRLYVGYRQPMMGSSNTGQIFPFLQLIGRVAVFTRQTNSALSWQYSCDLAIQNPYGSQTAGLDSLADPITGLVIAGDDFGYTIKVSQNLVTSQRMVAIRANYGVQKQNGAIVTVYEENSQSSNVISGILQLYDGKTQFDLNEKLSFAKDFDIGNDAVLAAVRGNVTAKQLTFFKRDPTTFQWNLLQLIPAPTTAAGEDFGVSICVNATGDQAIVGSPTLASGNAPGIGGSIYFLKRSKSKTQDTWAITQQVSDPAASLNTKGAFGYFLSVDKQFLVCAVSANQNNNLDAPVVKIGTTASADKPQLVFVAVNPTAGTIDTTNYQMLPQPGDTSDYIDPTFGAHTALALEDQNFNLLRVLANSPLNQTVTLREMSL